MDLQVFFKNFNPGKFLVHSCWMIFTGLFALRLDGFIEWNYWAVFTPLWFWKGMVILGATIGSFMWWKHPDSRGDGEAYVHYKAMLISLAMHLILLMFELLVCDKLESERHLWILVFIPLIFISIVSIAVSIWSLRNDRAFEHEFFCAVNVLQIIFFALRLDGFVTWSWEVVFVPFWALLCIALVTDLYFIISGLVLITSPDTNPRQKRDGLRNLIVYTIMIIPVVVFQVLLVNKLDGDSSHSYTTISIPLMISHASLIFISFGAKRGNRWWFGIRKDFCPFLLGSFPLLQEYGNISYQPRSAQDQPAESMVFEKNEKNIKKIDLTKPVEPIVSIDMPD